MFPEKREMSINFSSNSLWKHIMSTESGSFSDNGSLFVFSHFHPLKENWVSSMDNRQDESHRLSPDNYFWIILSKIPDSYFKQSIVTQTGLGKAIISFSLLILLIISILLSAYKEARRVDLHNTRIFARFDLMTKLHKREYGLNQLEIICNRKKSRIMASLHYSI